jgi:CRP-like cAMP-binding protein
MADILSTFSHPLFSPEDTIARNQLENQGRARPTMERIVEYFRSYAPVSDKGWLYFEERLEPAHYRYGDIIQPVQKPCEKLCFILKGVARSYLQKPDGRDFTWFFHYDSENSSAKQFILIDYPSFNLQTPSTYGFQALSRCQIASISYDNLKEVYQQFPEFLTLEKRLVVSAYQQNNLRLQSLLTKPARGRLEDFEQIHGVLFDMIPHYHIASYLGITPQRLCQLRRKRT